MSKYRARHCPNCNYFVGFAVARKHIKGRPISITNFCLNCNYKLPVYSIVRGIRTPTRVSRRTTLRLVRGKPELSGLDFVGRNRNHAMDVRISPADYARHLRAIGQDLRISILQRSTWNTSAMPIWSGCDRTSRLKTTTHFFGSARIACRSCGATKCRRARLATKNRPLFPQLKPANGYAMQYRN